MVTTINQTAGRCSYDMAVKLRQMDPGQAEAYQTKMWKEFQLKRITDSIEAAKLEYEDNIEKDIDNAPHYAARLRQTISEIQGIDLYPEFKEIYTSAKMQLEDMLATVGETRKLLTPPTMEASQPGMDDLSEDEVTISVPTLAETEAEDEERAAMNAKIDPVPEASQPGMDDLSEDEVKQTETTEEIQAPTEETTEGITDLAEAQAAYKAKTGNDCPARFKNSLERINSKLAL